MVTDEYIWRRAPLIVSFSAGIPGVILNLFATPEHRVNRDIALWTAFEMSNATWSYGNEGVGGKLGKITDRVGITFDIAVRRIYDHAIFCEGVLSPNM